MAKKHSLKFWIIFWVVSAIFLIGWYYFLQAKKQGAASLEKAVNLLPISSENKDKAKALSDLYAYLENQDGQEKTFLILLQNNLELRPGGGFIGSFGVVKVKNGEVGALEIHDTGNFDGRIPDTVEPPYPMKKTLAINSWKFRDSNYSPDFVVNAKKAEEFYQMGNGQENFDGIFAVNSGVLSSLLKATGPIAVPGYPGTYDSENAVLQLEKQVEQDFYTQDISVGERKSIMGDLAEEIYKKIFTLSYADKMKLAQIILEDLNNKDIQLYFKDASLEEKVRQAGWSGEVDENWQSDYLMMVDANLGAYKSDYYVKRSFDYYVDLSKETPTANLRITYNHTAKVKDFMTRNYLTYLRIYVPEESWLTGSQNLGELKFSRELGKKYFGSIVTVPLGEQKTVEFSYNLPVEFRDRPYDLLIQKQSGVSEISGKVTIVEKDGNKKTYDVNSKGDWTLSGN